MTRRVLARSILVLFVLSMPLAFAGPAFGATDTLTFTYGTDQASWYWTRQIDEEVTVDQLPPPAPVFVQRVRLPSGQDFATLPVAVTNGEVEKTSAIAFDLVSRDVEAGSVIQKYTLTIAQEDAPGDVFPTFNATDRMILACRIDDFWVAGEAELFEVQPVFDESACVEGKLNSPALPTEPPTWTWDLSQMAAAWGEDPFASNGVLLRPKLGAGGPTETWQINLKIPSRDDVDTPVINEYEETKDRVKVVVEYQPPPPEPPVPPVDGGFFPDPSTDFNPPEPPVTTPPTEEPAPDDGTGGEEPVATEEPRLPGYVWLLLPVGLVALSGVRSVILESATSTRPDGVIAAIRRRNAERRGWAADSLTEARPSRLAAPLLALWAAIKGDVANARSKLRRKPS